MGTLEAYYTRQEQNRIEHILVKDQCYWTLDDIDFMHEVQVRENVRAWKIQASGFPNHCNYGVMQ